MSAAIDLMRSALQGDDAWLVGGAVRDRLLERAIFDYDVAVAGDVATAAKRIAKASRGFAFSISDEFGTWRVLSKERDWQADVVSVANGDIEADLAARDFTINAIAQSLSSGQIVDPFEGAADLERRELRMVSQAVLASDPLRTLRGVRLAVELGFDLESNTSAAIRAEANGLERVAVERIFGEFKRIICSDDAIRGLHLLEEHGITQVILPEVVSLHGLEQNMFHHLDVYDHTLAVLEELIGFESDPSRFMPEDLARGVSDFTARSLADDLTRGDALRFAALLHDIAKPQTARITDDGRISFVGHDVEGATLVQQILRRWHASERLVEYVASLTLHHLKPGFLAHETPLSRRSVWRYLTDTGDVAIDVVVLSIADRLATRGQNADVAIDAHIKIARELIEHAMSREPRAPLIRGDDLAISLGIDPGPILSKLLAQIEEDRFVGEITTREEAVECARRVLDN